MVIQMKIAFFIAAMFVFTAAQANDVTSALTMRKLVVDALKDGSSQGYVDDSIAKMFSAATKSNAPVLVSMKKVQEFDQGCGRLRVEIKQDGIKDENGNAVEGMPPFEFSVCPDGHPPHEEVERVADANRAAMKSCTAKIEKGGVENSSGSMRAVITATGCPVSGKSHWRYSGDCKALEMPSNIDVTYPIDDKGHINIKLLVPPQCITANNAWHAIIMDSSKTPLGDITAKW